MEMALVLPVLVLLLCGIVDFGLTLSDQISLNQGVREGARQGVVAEFGATCAGTDREKLICFTEERSELDDVAVYIKLAPGSSDPDPGDELTVCASAPMHSITGFFQPLLDGRHITAETTMRVEVGSTLSEGGDPDPSGEGWSWCG